jgi:hypothetical protein
MPSSEGAWSRSYDRRLRAAKKDLTGAFQRCNRGRRGARSRSFDRPPNHREIAPSKFPTGRSAPRSVGRLHARATGDIHPAGGGSPPPVTPVAVTGGG